MKSLIEKNYVYQCKKYSDFDDVKDILWAHPEGTKLFNMFSTMLVLDSTCMNNKYCLLLLDFVGVTSNELKFYILKV